MSTSVITRSQPEAYVTLVATDNYVQGAIVLAYSIRNLGTSKLLICMVTPDLSVDSITHLSKVFDHVLPIKKLDTLDEENLRLLGRPELGLTVSKIHIWSLTWLDTVLFLDADTLVLKPLDHLFEEYRNIPFAACPDPGWPDCFNSGVFMCRPSSKIYEDLIKLLAVQGSFDGGDQGLLNAYFNDWSTSSEKRMPFIYNVTPNEVYSYAPAYKKHSQDIAVMHFIGKDKPWHQDDQNDTLDDQVTEEEWQEKITENLLTNLENKPTQLFNIKPDTSSQPTEDLDVKKEFINRQDYVEKWWEVYRSNIDCLNSIHDSLTSQGKRENQDKKAQPSSISLEPKAIHHQKENALPEIYITPPGNHDNYDKHNFHQQTYESKTNDSIDTNRKQERADNTHTKSKSLENRDAYPKRAPESTHVNYNFGQSSGRQSTHLPFRVHPEEIKLKERPILPESALSDLAERHMLTPAHQQARDANAPFPLFEAYREPRRPKKAPQVSDIKSLPQPPREIPEKSSTNHKDTSKHESKTIDNTGNNSPHSSTWSLTPTNNDSYSSLDGSGGSAPHSRMIIDTLLANTVNKITSDSPVSIKLTCVRSKSRMTSNGTYSTTYKLVWEESGNQSLVSPTTNGSKDYNYATPGIDTQSIASTSGFMTPEHDSDNESVESLTIGSYPSHPTLTNSFSDEKMEILPQDLQFNNNSKVETSLNHSNGVNEQSLKNDSLKAKSETLSSFNNPSKNVELSHSLSSDQLDHKKNSKTASNSTTIETQKPTTIPLKESINQPSNASVISDRKPARRTPIEYQLPPSSKEGFNNYRIQWNQSELRGWRPPQNMSNVSRYRDSEDPHDRLLRQRSTSDAAHSAPASNISSPR